MEQLTEQQKIFIVGFRTAEALLKKPGTPVCSLKEILAELPLYIATEETEEDREWREAYSYHLSE